MLLNIPRPAAATLLKWIQPSSPLASWAGVFRLQSLLSVARRPLFISSAVHGIIIGVLSFTLNPSSPKPGQDAMQVTFMDLGNSAPLGAPNGNTAPPKQTSQSEPKPNTKPTEAEPSEHQTNPQTEPTPVPDSQSDVPSMDANVAPQSSAQASAAESHVDGSGTLALGARVHGGLGGLDGDLAAAIGAAIATQIKACWEAPAISLPPSLAVTMTVTFHKDGSVSGPPIINRIIDETPILVTDPNAFETAAITAINRCSPVKLPAHLYPYWKQVDVEIFSAKPVGPAPQRTVHTEQ